MPQEPRAFWAAAPLQPAEVPTLTQERGVRQLLEHPPSVRHAGWNLQTLDRATLVEGKCLRVSNGDRKHLDLLADGIFLAIAAFDGFLSWGPHEFRDEPKISGVALVEFTYEFVALYQRLLDSFIEPRPQGIQFQVGIAHAIFATGGGGVNALYLNPGPIGALAPPQRHAAPAAQFSGTYDVALAQDDDFEVATVAYELVKRIYNWFGLLDEDIPYTTSDGRAIDMDAIKALR